VNAMIPVGFQLNFSPTATDRVNCDLSPMCGRKTAGTYLMAIMFLWTNLVRRVSGGGNGRANGCSDGDIEESKQALTEDKASA
jgi:hypothetical protein